MQAFLGRLSFASLASALALAASCSSSDQKTVGREGGAGGAGGDGDVAAGGAPMSPSGGGTANLAGAPGAVAGMPSGDAGGGGAPGSPMGGASAAGAASGDAGESGAQAGGQGGAGTACCDPVVDYRASSLLLPSEACQAWTLVDSAAPEDPLLSGGYLEIATSADGENLYFQHGIANLTVPATLTVEARVKLNSGSGSVAHRGPAGLGASYGPTHQKNLLFIAAGEIFILSGENTKGAAAAVATTDDFHVYKMVFDTAQNTVEVFYDGESVLTGSTFVDPSAAPSYISFGEATSFGHGASSWDYVTHNAYACVPE